MTKHIVNFSGGKDSTCMLLKMLELQMQIDYIIFCDTTKEFPQVYDHIEKVKSFIKKNYDKEITTLKAKYSFDYYMFEYQKIKGSRIGEKGYGWSSRQIRWCTQALKKQVVNQFINNLHDDVIQYIGIAYDEESRHLKVKNNNSIVHPLYEWKITEAQALAYCLEKGFDYEGLYEHFSRLSCWCCPLKSLDELRAMYKYYPKLWEQLKEMDHRSKNSYRKDLSIDDLELRFRLEELERKDLFFNKEKIF